MKIILKITQKKTKKKLKHSEPTLFKYSSRSKALQVLLKKSVFIKQDPGDELWFYHLFLKKILTYPKKKIKRQIIMMLSSSARTLIIKNSGH